MNKDKSTYSLPLWIRIQQTNIRKLSKLIEYLNIQPDTLEALEAFENKRFPINLPLRLANKIDRKYILTDPILLQFLPSKQENDPSPGFSKDPLEEASCRSTSKLLHKYKRRVLFLSTKCTVNCRYCFRSHFDYPENNSSIKEEVDYLKNDTSIDEIILSGGDPLSNKDEQLENLFIQFCDLKHIKKIRFHTRFPIGIPERIDEGFLNLLEKYSTRFQFWFMLHVNHPRELDIEIYSKLNKIQKLGIPIGTQSVLLRAINDKVEVLEELFVSLTNHGIFPYYLHQLDPIFGAHRFNVPIKEGIAIMNELQRIIPGYAVPKYVRETPRLRHKEILYTDLL